MKWLRKWTLAATTALVLAGSLLVAPTATANSPSTAASPSMGRQRIYYVYYRQDPQSPWYYAAYYSYSDAQWVAATLQVFGYDAFVR